MRAIIFGATGMVGKGLLIECLENEKIESILVIGRQSCALADPKLQEILHGDFFDYQLLQEQFKNYDACFFCLGVSSAGKSEEKYRRLTYDLTLAAADSLLQANKQISFVYVSAAGSDSSGKGKSMWARVRGQLENRLLKMPFKSVYILRPAYIQPLRGTKSRVDAYRILYNLLSWTYPLLRRLFPNYVSTTVKIAQAMINLLSSARVNGILEVSAINEMAGFVKSKN
jgi:uncharacterized protein YbjT (DUF2867 family)